MNSIMVTFIPTNNQLPWLNVVLKTVPQRSCRDVNVTKRLRLLPLNALEWEAGRASRVIDFESLLCTSSGAKKFDAF